MSLRFLTALALGLMIMIMGQAHAQMIVRVQAYPFPPFLNDDQKSGLSVDIVNLLNQTQTEYRFVINVAHPKDRYDAILSGKAHMMLFEMPDWNWQDHQDQVQFSKLLMKGGEVYIAKRQPDQLRFDFDQIEKRKIMAFEGYHYTFADLNADENWLKDHFDIVFTNSHAEMLKAVKQGDVDIAVVTLSYLKRFFHDQPADLLSYVVSQEFAQVYNLRALLNKNAPIDMAQLEKLFADLKQSGQLQNVLERYGVLRQWQF